MLIWGIDATAQDGDESACVGNPAQRATNALLVVLDVAGLGSAGQLQTGLQLNLKMGCNTVATVEVVATLLQTGLQ